MQFLTCKIPATVCGGCEAKDADSNEGLEAAEERAEMGRDGQSASWLDLMYLNMAMDQYL